MHQSTNRPVLLPDLTEYPGDSRRIANIDLAIQGCHSGFTKAAQCGTHLSARQYLLHFLTHQARSQPWSAATDSLAESVFVRQRGQFRWFDAGFWSTAEQDNGRSESSCQSQSDLRRHAPCAAGENHHLTGLAGSLLPRRYCDLLTGQRDRAARGQSDFQRPCALQLLYESIGDLLNRQFWSHVHCPRLHLGPLPADGLGQPR
jgi:hypothetical protein